MVLPERGELHVREHVPLAGFTTLKLGGSARYFVECTSVAQVYPAMRFAQRHGIQTHVLGGGSNTIFLDDGFDGLVLKIAFQGIQFVKDGSEVRLNVAAGESWDRFVQFCIRRNLAGIECLSGIPGLVGATPIQNVGAYGQEVANTIIEVKAIDRALLQEARFTNADCNFTYRKSRFNSSDTNRFIVTEVSFRLQEFGEPEIRYQELRTYVEANVDLQKRNPGSERLEAVRDSVLALRKKKSMVIDAEDLNSRSVGSFFKNPVLTKEEFLVFEARLRLEKPTVTVPTFPAGGDVKIPAAWLVENAGFGKGFRKAGAGVSSTHALALVNLGGTTRELLALAEEIQSAVFEQFGLFLEREPVVVHHAKP